MSDVDTPYQFAVDLLEASNQALAATISGAIGNAFIAQAIPALDCCPQLTVDLRGVTMESTQPSSPGPIGSHRGVQVPYVPMLRYMITIARCAPKPGKDGIPVPLDISTAAQETAQDIWAVWNHLNYLKREGGIFGTGCMGWYIEDPSPLQVQGGCAGWTIGVRVAVGGFTVAT